MGLHRLLEAAQAVRDLTDAIAERGGLLKKTA